MSSYTAAAQARRQPRFLRRQKRLLPNTIWLGACLPMNASQCYQAKLLFGISKERLAERAIVTVKIISEFEAGRRPLRADTSRMIRKAFERSGVIFSDTGDMPQFRLQEDVTLI